MTVQIKRSALTQIDVEVLAATGSRITVETVLWFARELQTAVEAGMDTQTEVKIDNQTGVNGVRLTACHIVKSEIA